MFGKWTNLISVVIVTSLPVIMYFIGTFISMGEFVFISEISTTRQYGLITFALLSTLLGGLSIVLGFLVLFVLFKVFIFIINPFIKE